MRVWSFILKEKRRIRLYYIDTVDKSVQLQMTVTNRMKAELIY
jgi:hypothetical protein